MSTFITSVGIMDDDEFGNDGDFAAIAEAAEHSSRTPVTGNIVSGTAPRVQQPKPQALASRSAPSAILVSPRQKGNPILNNIHSLPWEYSDIPSDYVLGYTTCALFLSLKYHRLHPEYIYSRIRALAGKYNLRILLTMIDIENHQESLKELSKTSLINNLTLILCWSAKEAARYLELYKSYEHASANSIRAHQATSYAETLIEFITVPRSINKTDAVGLVSAFGSVRAAINARPEEIAMIAGWGEKKVQRWCSTIRENFRASKAAKRGLATQRGDSLGAAVTAEDGFGHDDHSRASDSTTHSTVTATNHPTAPIPISTVPGRKQLHLTPATTTTRAPDTVTSAIVRPSKRAAEASPVWEVGDDDDVEALLLAAEADATQPIAAVPIVPTVQILGKSAQEGPVSEGVQAALARLRHRS